jgi:hypothetical protein
MNNIKKNLIETGLSNQIKSVGEEYKDSFLFSLFEKLNSYSKLYEKYLQDIEFEGCYEANQNIITKDFDSRIQLEIKDIKQMHTKLVKNIRRYLAVYPTMKEENKILEKILDILTILQYSNDIEIVENNYQQLRKIIKQKSDII